MAEISEDVRDAARAAEKAVADAVRQPNPRAVGAVERATNRLHKLFAGHLPDGGRSVIREARAELRYGVPGEACERLRGYLQGFAGGPALKVADPTAEKPAGKPKGA